MKQSIPLKSVANARELGGYQTVDGRTIRNGVLLRTANLNNITDEDICKLRDDFRLSDIIDFRMKMELTGYEDPEICGVTNTHLDVIDISEMSLPENQDIDINKLDLIQLVDICEQIGMLDEDMYIGFLMNDLGKKSFSRFFRILLAADPDRAVLWHCTSGKDRTGLAAMLLLAAFGVEESVIMDDYMLTNEYNAGRIEGTKKYLGARGCNVTLQEKAALVFDAVERRFMENAISFLNGKYGSVAGYIRTELNISDEEIAFLKDKYTK